MFVNVGCAVWKIVGVVEERRRKKKKEGAKSSSLTFSLSLSLSNSSTKKKHFLHVTILAETMITEQK